MKLMMEYKNMQICLHLRILFTNIFIFIYTNSVCFIF